MLLVEDDHGDAFLVSELLREEAAPVEVRRAQSLSEGLGARSGHLDRKSV